MPNRTPLFRLTLCLGAVLIVCALLVKLATPVPAPAAPQAAPIEPDTAAALAVNTLHASAEGAVLTHPRYQADFDAAGLTLTPRYGGSDWGWALTYAGSANGPLAGLTLSGIKPDSDTATRTISYARGALIERYVAGKAAVEQEFVLNAPLPLAGQDLLIEGAVRSTGTFTQDAQGWRWSDVHGAVTLGQVTVRDARGTQLPAQFSVEATRTRIVVDGAALAAAVYPVVIDPAIGANDFRLSEMGPDVRDVDATDADVAYNSTNNEYLVVWSADNINAPLVDEEYEIYGQRINAVSGALIGSQIRISDMGPDGNAAYDAVTPAVVYNPPQNEYVVVWNGNDTGDYDVYGQRLNAATGAQVGVNDFRISTLGPNGDTAYAVVNAPDIAINNAIGVPQYLVVWNGDDNRVPLVNDEVEIFGQRLDAYGVEIGVNDFRISDMGPDGNTAYSAGRPSALYNAARSEYLVVWSGDDNRAPLVEDEFEIFGQRLDPGGIEVGQNDFRISDMGPDGDPAYDALRPDLALNPLNALYLVVWSGDDNSAPFVDEEFEIFGQLLDGAGEPMGANDFRISDMGPNGSANFDAYRPAVTYNNSVNEFLVAWDGENDEAGQVESEFEIFSQRIYGATGVEVGTNDYRVSTMGATGTLFYPAYRPMVVSGGTANDYLIVWQAEDQTTTEVSEKSEIYARRLDRLAAAVYADLTRISYTIPAIDPGYDAFSPDIAYDSSQARYLVVWWGDDGTNDEFEIYGQCIEAATGAERLPNDLRLSDMGPDGSASARAANPAVAYNPDNFQYLVAWEGDDNTAPLADDEYEIYGQRINSSCTEIGTNDFRISDMGPDGDANYDAMLPAIAYNSTNQEYYVTWKGEEVDNDFEIYAQRIRASDGVEVGPNDAPVSNMAFTGNGNFLYNISSVAYNPTANEYLVVWSGDQITSDEYEIYGQRINAADGSEIGANDFRISDMGPDGNNTFDAHTPDITYNSTNVQYLAVWSGSDTTVGEFEIYGQLLDATGTEIGPNDFRISDMGPDGDSNYTAVDPSVAYSNATNQYLVVWEGDDNSVPLVNDELEIFSQGLNANATPVGGNDARLSDMGVNGDAGSDAANPVVIFRPNGDSAVIAWHGDDSSWPMVDDENEIFAQMYQFSTEIPSLPPTNTPVNPPTNTPQPLPSLTPTPPLLPPTNTPSATNTREGTPTDTPVVTATNTPIITATNTPVVTATDTPAVTATVTATPGILPYKMVLPIMLFNAP